MTVRLRAALAMTRTAPLPETTSHLLQHASLSLQLLKRFPTFPPHPRCFSQTFGGEPDFGAKMVWVHATLELPRPKVFLSCCASI